MIILPKPKSSTCKKIRDDMIKRSSLKLQKANEPDDLDLNFYI